MQRKLTTAILTTSLMGIVAVAGADTYKADTAHGQVGFSVSHLVISKVRGHFDDYDATLRFDGDGNLVGAKATIQVESIDTGIEKRDGHLRSEDFFYAKEYPTIAFESTKVEKRGGKIYLIGDLTMRGVTKPVELPVTINGPVQDPWGKTRIAFATSATVNRLDYGIAWNEKTEHGNLVVGEEVDIDVEVEFLKQE